MNIRHIVAATLALLVLGAGAAAATPGGAPSGVPADGQDSETNDGGPAADAGPAGDAGPPSELPGPVPEFVSSIHDQINGFLDGDVEDLGSAIADVTPGGEGGASDDAVDGEDAAGPTPTPA